MDGVALSNESYLSTRFMFCQPFFPLDKKRISNYNE
jgi:hypothetical protein